MSLRATLALYRRYYKAVADNAAPALLCPIEDGVLLYYVDDNDRVYLKCTVCDTVSYPGARQENEMRAYL